MWSCLFDRKIGCGPAQAVRVRRRMIPMRRCQDRSATEIPWVLSCLFLNSHPLDEMSRLFKLYTAFSFFHTFPSRPGGWTLNCAHCPSTSFPTPSWLDGEVVSFARIQRGPSEAARWESTETTSAPRLPPSLPPRHFIPSLLQTPIDVIRVGLARLA